MQFKMNFSVEDAEAAHREWGFNCGPGAICGLLGMPPSALRPHMGDFEEKRYTNPTLMYSVLRSLNRTFEVVYRGDSRAMLQPVVQSVNGLVRIQWDGSWTRPGVPMAARYRQTHWIAVRTDDSGAVYCFDVNMVNYGGWCKLEAWEEFVAPWIIANCVANGTGIFWPTHVLEVR